MSRQILSIGFDFPGLEDCVRGYSSDQSLLDADLIIFEPNIFEYSRDVDYGGKPCLAANSSFQFLAATEHWKRELSTCLQNGKTVFLFFAKFEEIYIHTGEKQFSGTGRNARTTNVVRTTDNYKFCPISLPTIVPKSGAGVTYLGHPAFATFWTEFRKFLTYESYLDGKVDVPLYVTRTANRTVGALFRIGQGHLALLPPLRLPEEYILTHGEDQSWTEAGLQVGKRLVQVLIEIDRSLRSSDEGTPPPPWSAGELFALPEVQRIRASMVQVAGQIDALKTEEVQLAEALKREEQLAGLLFEKGKPLERAIILSLELLGYSAENYNDGSLELDQIIISPEGDRFIGEAEGKDSSAINIEKFRQLEGNIQEDLARPEVSAPATGILFGNAFRLDAPDSRGEFFTEKCMRNAARLNAVLIRTPDLFSVARYLRTTPNVDFAARCRKAVLNARGKIVDFPEIPTD